MRIFSLLIMIFSLVACQNHSSDDSLRIGTVAGPEAELLETAKQVAKQNYDLNIKVIEFNDYHLLNEALNEGSIDANVFQHQPYLQNAIKIRHYHFDILGKTFLYPMGIYSKKVKNLDQLPQGATIAVPNDPSNETRALRLLQSAGLIQFSTEQPTSKADIKDNPKHIVLKEIESAQLPRILDDVNAAVINTNFAIPAGLIPSRDALYLENKDSPYANLIVSQQDTKKREQLKKFVQSFQSEAVKNKAEAIFGSAAISAW